MNKGCGTLLILGNGFDINLGFPTSYKDFFKSEQFPFVRNDQTCHSLGRFVFDKGVQNKWYDLENLLAVYGNTYQYRTYNGDKDDYKRLILGLAAYLETVDFSKPKTDSVAARILKAADDPLLPPAVYTFNYSSFETISSALGLNNYSCYHVHGSLKNHDIVLGVGEYVNLEPSLSFLYKTSSIYYNSNGILNSFNDYVNIIIFGLSLSQVDYPYFEDFFKDVAARKYIGLDKKYIRIITYDENSRLDILNNLRGMNSGLIKLGYSDFDIIRVKDNIDELKVQEVVEKLNKHVKVVY